MNSPVKDWRTELNSWLGNNPKQSPSDLQQLREAFVKRFPREHLSNLTLEEYASASPTVFATGWSLKHIVLAALLVEVPANGEFGGVKTIRNGNGIRHFSVVIRMTHLPAFDQDL